MSYSAKVDCVTLLELIHFGMFYCTNAFCDGAVNSLDLRNQNMWCNKLPIPLDYGSLANIHCICDMIVNSYGNRLAYPVISHSNLFALNPFHHCCRQVAASVKCLCSIWAM